MEKVESSDFSFLSKYIRDDSDNNADKEMNDFKQRFKSKDSGNVEVFGSIGEGESFSNNSAGFNGKKFHKKEEDFEEEDNIDDNEQKPSNNSEAKKEFLRKISEDSLSLDTCEKVGRDWNRN